MTAGPRVGTPQRFRVPVRIRAGVLANATVLGLISLAFPLLLADRGFDKGAIAAFFAVNAVVATVVNLAVSARVVRLRAPRVVLLGCLMTGAIGLGVLAAGPPPWGSYLCGAAVMAVTVSFPLHLHAVRSPDGGAGAAVAGLRMTFVIGYIAGLAAVAPASVAGPAGPLWLAAGLTLATAPLALWTDIAPTATGAGAGRAARPGDGAGAGRAARPGDGAGHTPVGVERAPYRPGPAALVAAVGAVLLLKASDSIRLVYLPLFATASGISPGPLAALLVVTAVVEIGALPLLGRAADRGGPGPVLRIVSLCGAFSFALIAVGAGYPVLVASSVVYAVFAAGFQSVGMVLLGRLLVSGTAAGAGLFTALMQVGSLTGIAAPLAVPGYRAGLFWIPAVLCLAAAPLLVVVDRLSRPTTGSVPVAGSVPAAGQREVHAEADCHEAGAAADRRQPSR